MTDWVGAQGLVKLAKNAKTSPIVTLPPDRTKFKRKKFCLQFCLEDLLNP